MQQQNNYEYALQLAVSGERDTFLQFSEKLIQLREHVVWRNLRKSLETITGIRVYPGEQSQTVSQMFGLEI